VVNLDRFFVRIYSGLKVFRNTSIEDNKMNYCRHLKFIAFFTALLVIFPILAGGWPTSSGPGC
jgi:hypothetical protein